MKELLAASAGAFSGWVISSVTDAIAIAMAAGAGIGILTAVALLSTRPISSVAKLAGAMAIGSLAGWLAASLADSLTLAMMIGSAVGLFATVAVTETRPVRSLIKVIGSMCVGFAFGWGIGAAVGSHKLGVALAIPFALALLMLLAESKTQLRPRHRPF